MSVQLNVKTVGQYLWDNPGTAALRALRESLVSQGVPLDQLRPTPGAGSVDAYQQATDPEVKLREYMKWVASTNQYSVSAVPRFLANAATAYLKTAAAPDGTLTRDAVEQKLGKKGVELFDLLHGAMAQAPLPQVTPAQSMINARLGKVSPPPVVIPPPPPLPPNALGTNGRAPDLAPLRVPKRVLAQLPPRVVVSDMRDVRGMEKQLAARVMRRDPARRLAKHLGKPAQTPRIAALEEQKAQAIKTQPFAGAKILVLQHLYRSTQSILDAAVACGAKPEDITVMGKPYSGSMPAAASMVDAGYNVVVPSLAQSELGDHEHHMEALVKEQVERLLASAPDEKTPLLVLDDGGAVAKMVHQHFPEQAHRFRFVEQTQRGANVIRELGPLKSPVINIAESRAKKDYESPSIGYSVFKETMGILNRLETSGATIQKEMTVLGFGAIGSQVAQEMRKAGYTVHVYDPDPVKQARARELGFEVHAEKKDALKHAHVLVGATGREAFALDDTQHLPRHAVFVNAASANNELNATNLMLMQVMASNAVSTLVKHTADGAEIPRHMLSALDTVTLDEQGRAFDTFQGRTVDLGMDDSATQRDRVVHTRDGKDVYFAHAGFVVNLTDDDDPIPPRYIGLTRSLLFAGLVQAATETRTGLQDLEDKVQQQIIDTTQGELRKTGETLLDPRF